MPLFVLCSPSSGARQPPYDLFFGIHPDAPRQHTAQALIKMQLKTARMPRLSQSLLTAFLCLGMAGHAFAEANDDPDRVVMPSEWVGRGFVAPPGEPHCIDEASVSLNGAALKRLCEAARNGDAQSQHNLGQLFYLTKGAQEQDYDDAYKWFHLAAEQGLPAAQYGLSLLHGNGLGIAGRIDEAIKWLTRAANSGHANAQFWLGIYYASAMRASDSDTEKALVWLRQSAKNGHPLAVEVLTNTSKRMTQGSGSASDTGTEYDFSNSLAACTEGYDINHPKPAAQEDQSASQGDAPRKKSAPYIYFTKADLLRSIQSSPETYLGAVGTCFSAAALRAGPGFVKLGK